MDFKLFNNGYIICYGLDGESTSASMTITYPITFSNYCIPVITKLLDSSASDQNCMVVRSFTLSSMYVNKINRTYTCLYIITGF